MRRVRYICLLTFPLLIIASLTLFSTDSSRRLPSSGTLVNGVQNALGLTLEVPKTHYLLGEGIHLYARLTNKGEQPLQVVTLSRPDVLFLTIDGQEVTKSWLARVFLAKSAGPEDILTLAPGQSHEAPALLRGAQPFSEGPHWIQATYDTQAHVPQGLPVWQGRVVTGRLHLTVKKPEGTEAEAYKLLAQIKERVESYRNLEPVVSPQTLQEQGQRLRNEVKASVLQLFQDHPTSVYAPTACWAFLVGFGPTRERADEIIEVAEKYLALPRDEDPWVQPSLAAVLAPAYHAKGEHGQALKWLKQCSPELQRSYQQQWERERKP